MMTLRRYLRAFRGALGMTLRGESITPVVESPLSEWTREYARLVNHVLVVADKEGVSQAARQAIKLRLDGRRMSLETTLMTLKFHATEEYPSLLRQGIKQGVLNTIYATNLNDRYWVTTMAAAAELQNPDLQAMLSALDSHLESIPRVNP